jgi:hypothetical protein
LQLCGHKLIAFNLLTSQLEDEFVAECKDVSGPDVCRAEANSAAQQPQNATQMLDFPSKGTQRESQASDRINQGSRVIGATQSQSSKQEKGGKKRRTNVSMINIKVNDAAGAPTKKNAKVAAILESSETAEVEEAISPGDKDKKQDSRLSLPETTRAAKYIFDLNAMQCIIEVCHDLISCLRFDAAVLHFICSFQDHESNVFEIDLHQDPLQPRISLAGEVGGLKPTAVAVASAEPRLFMVSRSAEAIELVWAFRCIHLGDYVSNR